MGTRQERLSLAAQRHPRVPPVVSSLSHCPCRVSFLKKAVDQRNRALASLNQVMNVSAALLSSQEGHKPIACTVTANWSCLLLQDTVTISCLLENCSEYSLEEGWTLCVQLLASPCALEEESMDSATTFTFPIDQLLPGNKRELTLPLGPAADTKLDLPLTISCALYYSLRDILGSGSDSSEDLDDFLPDDSPLLSPDREGICLPLSQCTIDMLQCLRFGSSPPGPSAPPAPSDPVETFLKVSREQTEPEEGKTPAEESLPPSAASIRVSSELLKSALKTSETGGSLERSIPGVTEGLLGQGRWQGGTVTAPLLGTESSVTPLPPPLPWHMWQWHNSVCPSVGRSSVTPAPSGAALGTRCQQCHISALSFGPQMSPFAVPPFAGCWLRTPGLRH